ncbi:MAG: hypothetical protein U1A78_10185 [Polyangia bacterium]
MGPEIFIVFIVFMTPVLLFFTQRYFRLREKQLEAQSSGRLLAASSAEQDKRDKQLQELQARIENLESILIDLDSSPRAALESSRARAARAVESGVKEPLAQLPAKSPAERTDSDE